MLLFRSSGTMVSAAIVVWVRVKLYVSGRHPERTVYRSSWVQSDCSLGRALRVGIASRCTVLRATTSGRPEDRPGFTCGIPVTHGAFGRPPSPWHGAAGGSAGVVEHEASSFEECFTEAVSPLGRPLQGYRASRICGLPIRASCGLEDPQRLPCVVVEARDWYRVPRAKDRSRWPARIRDWKDCVQEGSTWTDTIPLQVERIWRLQKQLGGCWWYGKCTGDP